MIDPIRFAATNEAVHGLLDRQQALRSEARATKREVAQRLPIPRHAQGGRFVRGPIPIDWLRVALAVGGKAGNLALAIWWVAGMEQANPVRITGKVLREFNVSPRSARRLLADFQQAGLVQVDRQRGRGPDVTLLSPTTNEPAEG